MKPKIYIEDFKGNYYVTMENHYLKLSPSKPNEDRRYNNIIIKQRVPKNKIRHLVHEQFSNTKEKWIYLGEHYEASKCMKDYEDDWVFVKENLPFHNEDCLFDKNRFYLFSHNGKLVYSYFTQYFPRCPLFTLNGDYAGWTTFKWLKPVFNVTQQKWV